MTLLIPYNVFRCKTMLRNFRIEVFGSHAGDYDDNLLVKCDTVHSGRKLLNN
jgi:hypothetical protein